MPSANVSSPLCVFRRQQFAFNNISSETARPRALIFGMLHCLVDFYQVWSNGGSGFQNDPTSGDLRFKNVISLKTFFHRTARLRCLKFGMQHSLVVLYQAGSNPVPWVQDGPVTGGPRFEP